MLQGLEQQQSAQLQQQTQGFIKGLIETKLELSAFYSYLDPDKSLAYLEEAHQLDHQHLMARNLYAALLLRFGEIEKARDLWLNGLALMKDKPVKDKEMKAAFLGNLGNAYRRLGQYDKAIDYYELALAISREIKDRQGEGNRLNGLGNAYFSLGQYDKAIEYYELALTISREIKDRQAEGIRLGGLGTVYYSLGQYEKALDYMN